MEKGMKVSLLVAGGLVLLSGCQSLAGRGFESTDIMVDVPGPPQDEWVMRSAPGMPSNDWVADFSDPVLTALIHEALEHNTDIRAAAAVYDAALARADIAGAGKLPNITGSASIVRQDMANSSQAGSTVFGLRANASWELDLWGRIRDTANAAGLGAAGFQADYAGARLAVAGQVAQNWFSLIESRLLVELSERDVETQERALRLTERRFDSGIVGSSDVRLARSALANAEALLASRTQTRSSLARSLEILLRRYPAEAITATRDLPPLPVLDGVGIPSETLRRRPDLIAAEYRLQSAGLDVDIARKRLYPALSLSGTVNSNSTDLLKIFDLRSFADRISADLTQPVFNSGRLKNDVRQQRALLRQQVENYAGTVLDAYLEVENALDAEQRLQQLETALRVSLNEAIEAEDRLEIRYSEGLATILQLLDAQSRRISAEGRLINARKERLANRVRLHVALGGGNYGGVAPRMELASASGTEKVSAWTTE